MSDHPKLPYTECRYRLISEQTGARVPGCIHQRYVRCRCDLEDQKGKKP